jgi:hypothetical protein
MKERPILFQDAMVRAILQDRKTQTRRIVKLTDSGRVKKPGSSLNWHPEDPNAILACPHGLPGDHLWVREAWQSLNDSGISYTLCPPEPGCQIRYRATDETGWIPRLPWRPSIFLPRWASRITLEIEQVRIQRLQNITEADALAEGYTLPCEDEYWSICRAWYQDLWKKINGPESWEANPWVWAITFKRITP